MPIDNPRFVKSLRSICSAVVADAERRAVYESDGLTARRQQPGLVVLPDRVQQVQQIARLCHDHDVPLVARGAGTGLSGGATPHKDGVLLVLAKFNRILNVDVGNLTAVVEPGVTNLAISEAVTDLGFYYAPDPSSQIACTIGGNVAENAGGIHCLKYGLTLHNVKALKIVLPDGELLTLGGPGYDAPGLDLLSVLHGSEGMLGIIVEVTVRLLPKPESAAVVMAAFERIEDAAGSVSGIIGSGVLPAGLEMMDQLAIRAAEAYVKADYPTGAGALLLCELDGSAREVEDQLTMITPILTRHHVVSVSVARHADDRARLWRGRKAAFPAVGRIAPDYYCMDGTIPRGELSKVLLAIGELSRRYGLSVANVFHAGDGNLHPLILYDASDPVQLKHAEQFGSEILQLCIQHGGTITGEHGVGIEKINEMCVQFNAAELGIFHGIKHAFDERGILNPGKAIPTLSRCAEFGAMHVHAGEEKFPMLDRF